MLFREVIPIAYKTSMYSLGAKRRLQYQNVEAGGTYAQGAPDCSYSELLLHHKQIVLRAHLDIVGCLLNRLVLSTSHQN